MVSMCRFRDLGKSQVVEQRNLGNPTRTLTLVAEEFNPEWNWKCTESEFYRNIEKRFPKYPHILGHDKIQKHTLLLVKTASENKVLWVNNIHPETFGIDARMATSSGVQTYLYSPDFRKERAPFSDHNIHSVIIEDPAIHKESASQKQSLADEIAKTVQYIKRLENNVTHGKRGKDGKHRPGRMQREIRLQRQQLANLEREQENDKNLSKYSQLVKDVYESQVSYWRKQSELSMYS